MSRMRLFKKRDHDYLSEMHLLIDDLKELQDQRIAAYNNGDKGEGEFYDRLIEGAQKVLEFMQEETVNVRH